MWELHLNIGKSSAKTAEFSLLLVCFWIKFYPASYVLKSTKTPEFSLLMRYATIGIKFYRP